MGVANQFIFFDDLEIGKAYNNIKWFKPFLKFWPRHFWVVWGGGVGVATSGNKLINK